MRYKHLIIFLLLLLPFWLSAQYYLSGEDPASLRWKQISTNYFRIIYPEQSALQAQKLARLLDQTYQASRLDIASPAVKSDLILHNQSVISNASVAWAPRRLDFYTTPAQDGYAQNWFKQLAAHELRHVAQISKLNQGFGHALNIIVGEQASAALLGAFIPLWFMEGDAVTNETMLSFSGRGRDGIFLSKLRAQLLQKGFYVYDKAYFDSYKDYTPNIYELGYYLVAHNKVKYGSLLWENALRQTARKPYTLVPFSLGIKQITGGGKNRLYKETMYDLYENWKVDYDTSYYTAVEQLSPSKKAYTSYRFPQKIADGSFVALRTAIDAVNELVLINQGQEKVLFTPGAIFPYSLSATDSLVVWTELQPDLRWPNRDYAVIKVGALDKNSIRQLTFKSRYFAPDISANNLNIACVNSLPEGVHYLTILDAKNGDIVLERSLEAYFPATPKWHPNNHQIVVVMTGNDGKALFLFDTQSDSWEQLSPFGFTDIQLSDVTANQVVFSASQDEVSQVYALNIETRTIKKLVSVPFGATDAIFDTQQQQLVFADYTADGFRLAAAKTQNFLNETIDAKLPANFPLAQELSQMRSLVIDTLPTNDSLFPEKEYSKLAHLFNFHSWSPAFIDVDNISLKPGVSLFSQNSLSTMVTELGYAYDLNEQVGKTSVNLQYRGFYPILNAGFSSGLRRDQTVIDSTLYQLKWQETDWNFSAQLPLNFTRNKWLRGLQPGLSVRFLKRTMDADVGLNFRESSATAFSYDVFAYQQLRLSKRDIYPRFGQNLQLVFRHSPLANEPSEQFFAAANLYFPGLFKHHGIKLYAAYQQENSGFYSFGNLVSVARGYNNLFFDQKSSFKLDYVFPIAYPDVNLPTFFYLQRLRGGLFADHFMGENLQNNISLSSLGAELYSDWYFFNLPAPIILGGRLSRAFDNDEWVAEFLFGININALY
ncbi:MAG: hypothetical protein RBR87_03570 [Bacteroidales bacterium]|jgi:hypothetical protein|nr:hypothetical protein [Bacteroidales bacterium]